jgi:drug/metabolite transporter (DMT)-like permease
MGVTEWLLLLTLSVLWGGSFFFNAVALTDLPPLTVVFARVAIAALVLWLVIVIGARRPHVTLSLCLAFVAMGVLNNVIPFTLIVWGQTRIGSGLAAILNATTPLFTVLLAHWLTRDERMSPARLGGVACGLAGVAVMIGPQALEDLGLDVLAQLAVIGAAVSYAFAGIFGRRFRGTPPLVTAAGQLSASALIMLPLVLMVDRPMSLATPSAATWGAVLGLSVFSTAVAYVIYFRILARAGATNLLLVTFLIPVSALLLGIGVLGEVLQTRELAGMALIGLGLAAIDGRPVAACLAIMNRRRSPTSRRHALPARDPSSRRWHRYGWDPRR